jgi:chromosomal replication initiator protein
MKKVINCVCKYYKIGTKELIGRSRKPNYVIPRHMVQYLMRNELNMNYVEIAKVFKRRHNSIMHGVKCIDTQLTNKLDASIKNDLISLKQNLLTIINK